MKVLQSRERLEFQEDVECGIHPESGGGIEGLKMWLTQKAYEPEDPRYRSLIEALARMKQSNTVAV